MTWCCHLAALIAEGFEQQLDSVAQVLARLLQSVSLADGARKLLTPGAIAAALGLRAFLENRGELQFHAVIVARVLSPRPWPSLFLRSAAGRRRTGCRPRRSRRSRRWVP